VLDRTLSRSVKVLRLIQGFLYLDIGAWRSRMDQLETRNLLSSFDGCSMNAVGHLDRFLVHFVDASKGELLVLLDGVQPKILGVEVKHRKDQDEGSVNAQLLTFPQVRFPQTRREGSVFLLGNGLGQRLTIWFQATVQLLLKGLKRRVHKQLLVTFICAQT
jgi:hypothetical protein